MPGGTTTTEIKAQFTADTTDFARGTARAAKDLARVAEEADDTQEQTDDLSRALGMLAREFVKGALAAIKETKAIAAAGDAALEAKNDVERLTGEAKDLHRELKRIDGMNVEPDIKTGRIRRALLGIHGGLGSVGGKIGELLGQLPVLGGQFAKLGEAAPQVMAGLAGIAAAMALLAAPIALAAGAAVAALAAIGLLSKWVSTDPAAATMRDAWAGVMVPLRALMDLIKTQLVPVLTGIATAVAPAVIGVLQSLQTWWLNNKRAVEQFLINLTKLGLQGVAAMASMASGIIKVLGPMIAWIIRAIGRLAEKFADWFRAMSHVPGFGWMADIADDLDGIGEAAGPMADSIDDASRAAQEALGMVRDGAKDAYTRMEQLDGNYNIFVNTWYRQHGVPPSGITGHPDTGMYVPPSVTGPMPAVALAPTAPAAALAQPRAAAAGGVVVNVDARGSLGLNPADLQKAVVLAIKSYERRNGRGWRN